MNNMLIQDQIKEQTCIALSACYDVCNTDLLFHLTVMNAKHILTLSMETACNLLLSTWLQLTGIILVNLEEESRNYGDDDGDCR